MKKYFAIFLLTFFLLFPAPALAYSSYVLPYPGVMPGGIAYKMHLVWEKLMQYWYFGDFAQFTYNLKESDKYLVEAKTLFAYNQYLLGYSALQKSNTYFAQTFPFLQKAKQHGKDTTDNRLLLRQAAEKHIETLMQMEKETPPSIVWSPEKTNATILALHTLINNAIAIREKDL